MMKTKEETKMPKQNHQVESANHKLLKDTPVDKHGSKELL